MTSFISVPTCYDVQVNDRQFVHVVCTRHPKPISLSYNKEIVGVDEIIRLIEEHELAFH